MKSVLYFAGVMVVLAAILPAISHPGSLQQWRDQMRGGPVTAKAPQSRPAPIPIARAEAKPAKKPKRVKRGHAVIPLDRSGHFRAVAKLNGKSVEVLVDTGASSVAINHSLAKRLGIRLRKKDFIHTARTANGETRFAQATLKSVRIGKVEVRDVEAAVLQDSSLDGVLLGMSFLGQLKSFGVENGELVLVR